MADINGGRWASVLSSKLGEEIREERKRRGMSAVKLAEATTALGAPMHRMSITRIEQGEQQVSVVELVALAIALEADWARWMETATADLNTPGARSDRAFLRKFIADLDQELEQQRHSLFQEEEGRKQLSIPPRYAETLAEQAARRREHIEALERQRARYADELERLDNA